MPYTVRIRRNFDNLIRTRTMDLDWSDDNDSSLFWWTEGNFGCDCNREWEFQRAAGEQESDDPECSEHRYSVLDAALPDGRVIRIDPDQ